MARSFAQSDAPVARLQHLSLFLGTALGALVTLTASSACAGAWTPSRGQTNVIVSSSISKTPVDERAVTTDLYYERGLGRGWAVVFAPSLSDQDNAFARNEAQISIRRALYEQSGWALSAQAGAYIWQETEASESSSGMEYRLAAGKSFGDGGWLNLEAATRQCGGAGNVRWEGAIGHKVRRIDRAIFKVFGDGEGCAASISRVQASYVLGITANVGVELGWRETLPSPGNWNERGAVIGLWLKF